MIIMTVSYSLSRSLMISPLIYARKSSESEDRQALSIESQIAELTGLAQRSGLEIDAIYQESQSARKPGRPEFSRMLKDLNKRPGGIILCWKLDRPARNLQDAATLSQHLQDGIIGEIRTPTTTYGNSSMDLFVSGLDFLIAKKYVDDLSENVKRGLRQKIQKGWFPGRPPLGYMTSGPYRHGLRTVAPDPRTYDKIQKVWDRMLRRPTPVRKIATYAKAIGLDITPSALYKLFSNPFYYGHFLWNGELYPGKHHPMITFEEFKKVRGFINRNRKKKQVRHAFTFSGLLKCGECGSAVTAERKIKLVRGANRSRTYIYYHCTHKKNPRCRQRSITETELCQQIAAYLDSISIPLQKAEHYRRALTKRELLKRLKVIPSPETQHRQLSEIDHQITGLISLKLSSKNTNHVFLTDEEYLRKKSQLLTKRQQLLEVTSEIDRVRKEVDIGVASRVALAVHGKRRFLDGNNAVKRLIGLELGSNLFLLDKTLMFPGRNACLQKSFPLAPGLVHDDRT